MKAVKRTILRSSLAAAVSILAVVVTFIPANAASSYPKYVFFFIGDGMASSQVNSAEVYLSELKAPVPPGVPSRTRLSMSTLPVHGMATTFGHSSYIPDSADAGTALATGKKTNSGIISMDPTGTTPYTSIATLAKRKGMKVGIVSSVSIDHATPAVFYANQPSRSNYYAIAMTMANSDFDYFGGGGVKEMNGKNGSQPSVKDAAVANGFVWADTRAAFNALKPGKKAIAINPILDADKALYYELDRKHQAGMTDHISLAQFTNKGIQLLDNPNGFFMMVEGGKIDWACHANDARASIDDTIALSNAVRVALDFYNQHPNDTLIVVTADHETGGMTLGWAGTKYDTHFEVLQGQNKSYMELDKDIAAYKANGQPHVDIDATMKQMIQQSFGLDFDTLKAYEKEDLEAAYDRTMGAAAVDPDRDYLLYGGYTPLSITLTHVLDQHAGIGWTSYSHTGVPVPVFATGAGSEAFAGFYDNTTIAKSLANAMLVHLAN